MTDRLREAATAALTVLVELNLHGFVLADYADPMTDAIEALRAALADTPQSTHSEDGYKWHHACAVARIERAEHLDQTVTVRYDASAAQVESALRNKLITLGWTPPTTKPEPT